jgi:hypothetical protein
MLCVRVCECVCVCVCVCAGIAYHQYAKMKPRLENAQAKINEVPILEAKP